MADEVVIDLTNYKDRVGSRVTPGRYRVYVEDAELDKTRDGAPMINVWLRVQGGSFDGATIIDRLLPQHEKAMFRVVGFMQAIGLPTPKKRMKMNIQTFIGKSLEVDIEDGDPYNGRVKSEIRGYYRIEGKKSDDAEAKDLDDVADEAAPATVAAAAPAAAAESDGANEFTKEETSNPSKGDDDEVDLDDLDLG